jgi:predicted Rossmann fold nucleotide-binding protein DprA/Smf involved in DNA uptake
LINAGAKLAENPDFVIEVLLPALRERVDKHEVKLDNDKERQVFWFLSLEGRHIDHLIENSELSPAPVSATLKKFGFRVLICQLSGKIYLSNCDTK